VKDRPKPTRASVLHAVIEEILERNDGQLPTGVDGIDAHFDNVEDLANAVLLRWHTRLIASLERGLINDPEDRREAVIEAWRHAAEVYSGVRTVIDQLGANPPTDRVRYAVMTTLRNDRAAMAIAAGLASGVDAAAVRVGHQLELEARSRGLTQHRTGRRSRTSSVLHRLRATRTRDRSEHL
jgi:AcrR family transcriptional regulator